MATKISSRMGFTPTMQPNPVDTPPEGDAWLHEIKYDGYRTELLLNGAERHAFTRNGHDWSDKYTLILEATRALPSNSCLLDGEIIVQADSGISDFHAVRQAISSNPESLIFYAFDILWINGQDIRREKLIDRRSWLHDLIGEHDPRYPIQFSDHIVGNGQAFFHQVEKLGLEGIVSKRSDSSYRSGYSNAWLKTKAFTSEQLVIVGFQQGKGPTMALCARETPHGLEYVGGAMLTLSNYDRQRFWEAVDILSRPTPALKLDKAKKAQWLEPRIRARIRHLRGEEKLRHATVAELLS